MANTLDIKGTSLNSFKIGLTGPTLNASGSSSVLLNNDAKLLTEKDLGKAALSPGYTSGKYYFYNCLYSSTSNGANATANNQITYVPSYIGSTVTISSLAVNVAATVASSFVRIGIYSNNYQTGLPANLIVDAGEVDCSTTGFKESVINTTLNPGWYWFAANASGTPNMRSGTAFLGLNAFIGISSLSTSSRGGYRETGVTYGALPTSSTPANISDTTLSCICFWYKIA